MVELSLGFFFGFKSKADKLSYIDIGDNQLIAKGKIKYENKIEFYWHLHHGVLVENLTEPLKTRKDYIKSSKPEDEVKLRLKLLKKVKCPIKDYPHTIKGWNDLHKKECKKCPWNGSSIFPNKGKT